VISNWTPACAGVTTVSLVGYRAQCNIIVLRIGIFRFEIYLRFDAYDLKFIGERHGINLDLFFNSSDN
jgi:hypothetical protein